LNGIAAVTLDDGQTAAAVQAELRAAIVGAQSESCHTQVNRVIGTGGSLPDL
jgi:polysaccharide deacetylase 2 family uncharacterized protein YibQ